MRTKYLTLILFLLVAVLISCKSKEKDTPSTQSTPSEGLRVGSVAPNFSLPSSDGQTVSLADYVNKQPVLLYFHMAVG